MPRQLGCAPWCGCGGEVEGATARKPEATPIRKYFRIGRGWRHPRPSRSKSWTGQRQDARGRSGGTCQRHPLKRHSRPVSRTGNSSRALGLLCNFPQGGLCCWPQAGCSLCCGDEHGFNSSGFPPHRIRAASWVPGGVANTKRGYKWGYKKKNESTKPRIHAGFKASFSSRQLIGSGAFSLSCAVPWSITASQHFVGISVGRWRCRLPTAVQGCQALAGRDAPWVRRCRHAPGCGRWPWRGTWPHRPGPAGW